MGYIIYAPLIIVIILYVIVKHLFTYWDRQGIINIPPTIVYGNLRPTIKHQKSFQTNINDLYWEAVTVPYIGIYLLCRPALLIRDLNLVKRILIQDQEFFKHRGIYCDTQQDPMSMNLFSATDASHTNLHAKLSPLFSKMMTTNLFETVHREGRSLINELGKYVNDVKPVVNLHKLLHTHLLNVIGGIFLGLKINLFENDDESFKYFNEDIAQNLSRFKQAQAFLYPGTMKITKKTHFPRNAQSFLMKSVENAMRGGNGIIHALTANEVRESDTNRLSNATIAAQIFSFYYIGNQTLHQIVISCLTELLNNPDTLDKLLVENDTILKKHHAQLSYDALQEMTYLDLCLKETLRKSPPTAIITRECTKDYIIEESGQTIKKGIKVIIPLASIQNDDTYFTNPKDFMPERFLEENEKFIYDAYMPYGSGSRQCPAKQLSELIVKCAIVNVISSFTILINNEKDDNQPTTINKPHTNETLLKNVIIKPRV
ncbi:probable cytochrome P450 6d5 [Culicoides brevitarsis]|uniref:probable cytochrome P450 6d5 n=1 Tax=Culicoides brevitarsis TaxID=469753 RepID=UPI00307C12EB